VAPASALQVGTRERPSTDIDNSTNLQEAVPEWRPKEKHIEELQINAHCPFNVSWDGNNIRIFCDKSQLKNCANNPAHCRDVMDNCYQAYVVVANSSARTKAPKGTKVELGCMYHPKGSGVSEEATNPAHHPGAVQ
jgi:hypothetical protein